MATKHWFLDITGKLEENEVFYKFWLLKVLTNFTIPLPGRAEHRQKLEKDMVKIIESFKELPHPAEELPSPHLSDSVSIQQNWPEFIRPLFSIKPVYILDFART